ncbi:MAG: pyridoxal-dependent decarboxylase, exosortase A system-associated [Casimicrobiaceae bacterium]
MPALSAQSHVPVSSFPVANGELFLGGKPISCVAAEVGRTPFYFYERRAIDARIDELRSALRGNIALHYAIKANPMPVLVAHMSRLVDGLDVASGGELSIALDSGTDPGRISFAGPGKTETELAQALAANILINIESFREIRLLAALSKQCGRAARVAVRVNPDFELKSSGMKMGGGPKQFGIDAEQVPAALAAIKDAALAFEGFHIFSGSQNLQASAICEAQTRAFDLAVRLALTAPSPVRTLNMGGGFGIPYFPGDKPLDLGAIGHHLEKIAAEAGQLLPEAKLVIELGRYLVGEAGIYVCRIIDRKISRGQVFLITDGGLHHHLAASGNFGQVIRKNYPVAIGNRMGSTEVEEVSIVGPLCTPLDLLADRMLLPKAGEGDLVVIFQSGAYGLTASPRGFLSHPEPLEILV